MGSEMCIRDSSGTAISVTEISSGDEITVLNEEVMRHIGISVQGEVTEK